MESVSLIIVFIVGLFAGFINVIVGSGSSVTIPILIFLGLPPHVAIGTNRFAMLFNNFTGAVRYHMKNYLHTKIAVWFSVFASIGAVIGAFLVLETKPEVLKQIIAGVLIIESLVLVFSKNRFGTENILVELSKKHYLMSGIFGFVVGLYGGFIGMAMTSLLIFLLVLFFQFSFIRSAAVAKVVTFAVSLFATIVFFFGLKVDLIVGLILAVSYVIGAFLGVSSAIKMGDSRVKTLFIFVVLFSAIKLLFY